MKYIPKISSIYSFLATILSTFLFLLISLWSQISQIITLELNLMQKFNSVYYIISESFLAVSIFSNLLFILWILSLFTFYITFFSIVIVKSKIQKENKKQNKNLSQISNNLQIINENNLKNNIFGLFSFTFSFISFGCIACGQALLFSILTLFISTISISLAHAAADFIMVIAILFLFYATYRNYKILKNPRICPIV